MKNIPAAVREEFPDLHIKDYTITGVVGEGGQGVVLQLEKGGATYTGKVVHRNWSLAEHIPALRGLQRGVELSQQLNHPSIQQVTEVIDEVEKRRFIVVKPYVQGRSLREMIDAERVIPPERLLDILDKTLTALEYLHSPGQHPSLPEAVYHRDVKPEHIIVADDGSVTLIDLDTAKPSGGKTTQLTAAGTRIYAAPEALLGTNDARSDVYSLGFVAVEALLGKVPVELSDSRFPWRGAYTLPPYVPEELRRVVDRMVVADPDQRWQSAAEVRNALSLEEKVDLVIGKELAVFKERKELLRTAINRNYSIQAIVSTTGLITLGLSGYFYYLGDLPVAIGLGIGGVVWTGLIQASFHSMRKDFKKEHDVLDYNIKVLEAGDELQALKRWSDLEHIAKNESYSPAFLSLIVSAVSTLFYWALGGDDPFSIPIIITGITGIGGGAMALNGFRHGRKEKLLEQRIDVLEGELASAHTLVDYQTPAVEHQAAKSLLVPRAEERLPYAVVEKPGIFTRIVRKMEGWESATDPGYEIIAGIALSDNNPSAHIKTVRIATHSRDEETRSLAQEMVTVYGKDNDFSNSYPCKIGPTKVPGYAQHKRGQERLRALEVLCEARDIGTWQLNTADLYTIARYDPSPEVKKLAEEMVQCYENDRDFSRTKPFVRRVIDEYATTLFSMAVTPIDEHMYTVMRDRYKIYLVDRGLARANTFADYQASHDAHMHARLAFIDTFPNHPMCLRVRELTQVFPVTQLERKAKYDVKTVPYGIVMTPKVADNIELKILPRKLKE